MPKASPAPAGARHLAASMRVVALHQRRPRVGIGDARAEVPRAAGLVKAGVAGSDTLDLVQRLEEVTGVSIAELEQCALGLHDA